MTAGAPSLVVLGVDPGYAQCGLAVVEVHGPQTRRLRVWETVQTPSRETFHLRLRAVWRRLRALAGELPHPALLAIEAQDGAQEGHRQRGTTSAEATRVREVVGLVRAVGWELGLPVEEVTPAAARRSLGLPAGAQKAQVARAIGVLLQAPPGRVASHCTDAAAVAFAAAARIR